MRRVLGAGLAALLLVAAVMSALWFYSRGPAPLPVQQTIGPKPKLPAPRAQILPTIAVARAVGWPDGASPRAPDGFRVNRFASGLKHPRWLYVLPNGDVLVAESSTRPPKGGGIQGWVQNAMQQAAGAAPPSADRITLLRDTDGDGVAERTEILLEHLNQPFGMLLLQNSLYVANTDEILRFPYREDDTRITAAGRSVMALPTHQPDNGHWTRNIVASPDGSKIYVAVGSSSNLGNNGVTAETRRANVLEISPDGSSERSFASGLRNPVGLAWEPGTRRLWATVNERDMLGNDLAPDFLTPLQDNGFYGWPYAYWGKNIDPRIATQNQRPDLVAQSITPDYSLGSHTAPLGLLFYSATQFPHRYHGGVFIAQHGSWNREIRVGYKVVFLSFANGVPQGLPEDFLTDFLDQDQEAQGRPVGLAVDKTGALLVADDVGGIIWRVAAKP